MMSDQLWSKTRLYALLQRPNAQLRWELRRSLQNIKETTEVGDPPRVYLLRYIPFLSLLI